VATEALVREIEYPDVSVPSEAFDDLTPLTPPPTVRRFEELEFVDLTLEQAVRQALSNSEVIRQAGGRIVASPTTASTVLDPSIVETDPRVGIEAALSAFDAQFLATAGFSHQDRELNTLNPAFRYRREEGERYRVGVGKIAATGTQFGFDSETIGVSTNVPFNRVPSTYEMVTSATVRHPFLQGGGLEFNRIAGPGAGPGNYRGVVLGRINTDIALAEFELSVRNLMRDVERAYWELSFAYRDLDSKLSFRQYALEAWELEKKRVEANIRPPDQEAFVREQYYAAQAAVENAISGANVTPGVFGAERELRSLLGLTASDGRLLRPITPPTTADLHFDWEESLGMSLVRREELRRQRWRVKQRELERLAAKNFLLPRLDGVGQYNWRGFGDTLGGSSAGAFQELYNGDLGGWTLGLEMATPIGQRAGHAAVRNADLLLRREQAILREQERQVSLELRGAFTELDRAYVVTRSNYNRHVAAQIQLEAERKRNTVGETRLDLVLQAQRNAVVAEVAFHRALVEYNVAASQLNLARGTLLESLQVYLAESPLPASTYQSAIREARRFTRHGHVSREAIPAPFSAGVYPQGVATPPMGPTDAASDPLLPSAPDPNRSPTTAPPPREGDKEAAPRTGPVPAEQKPVPAEQKPVPAELIPAPAPDLGGMIES
jgi:outer membrane protein TolC